MRVWASYIQADQNVELFDESQQGLPKLLKKCMELLLDESRRHGAVPS